MESTDVLLQIRDLTKTYPSGVMALRGIDLNAPAGMFGLLGPNGAGKTTLIKILATLLEPDGGTAHLKGVDLITDKMATRRILGYLPQDFGLYPSLTALQMLDYLARLKGTSNATERRAQVGALLEKVNLSSVAQQKLGTYSGGMRQRFGIAQALLGAPQLLIVDEPTAGLDPEERVRFHNLLAELAADIVVLLSTHIVSDVANLCSHMAVIRRGEIIAVSTPVEAISQLEGCVWEALVSRAQVAELRAQFNVLSTQIYAGGVRIRILFHGGRPSEEFAPVPSSLEDYYFNLINQAN